MHSVKLNALLPCTYASRTIATARAAQHYSKEQALDRSTPSQRYNSSRALSASTARQATPARR